MTDALPVSLHNVAETKPAEWAEGGRHLLRAPAAVRERLNVSARSSMHVGSGCELRFVPTGSDPVEVTVSASEPVTIGVFWGSYQHEVETVIRQEPATLELEVPPRIEALKDAGRAAGPFDPRVCRVRLGLKTPVAVHDATGPCRPPEESEVPGLRYFAYGTSITEGKAASLAHLTYVSQTARRLGADALNFGMSGAAFCEPVVGEYVAGREDWDVVTLGVSVNMSTKGFTGEQFRERAADLVNTVAAAHPDKPVVPVTLFPYHGDLVEGVSDPDRASEFREILRDVAAETPHDNVHLVEGPDLLDPAGLTTDVIHPGDAGMTAIADGLADVLGDLVE